MEMKGEHLLPTDRDTAWRLLNDTQVLEQCLPGCESMTAAADGSYDIAMTAAVGPVKARFKAKMTLADVEPSAGRYRLIFEGRSAQAGFARGEARVALEPVSAEETRLRYTATTQIGGKLAQIGSRLIDAAAAATADRFFTAFAAQLAAACPARNTAAPDPPAPAEPAHEPETRQGDGKRAGKRFGRRLGSLFRHLLAPRGAGEP